MSKVKPVVGVPKSKLLRRNRRTETRNKKAERSNTAKNDPKGSYYLQTEKLVGELSLTGPAGLATHVIVNLPFDGVPAHFKL